MTNTEIDGLLQEVHNIRTILIDVGTGKRRIEEAESEYTQLRSHLSPKLLAVGINDANAFISLWDWYSYWKEKGFTTYQPRREYANTLYKPVVTALEEIKSKQNAESIEDQSFSARYGYAEKRSNNEITIREDAPKPFRSMLVDIAKRTGWEYSELLQVALRVGKESWQKSDSQESGKTSLYLLMRLVFGWQWYQIYDFIEDIFRTMCEWDIDGHPEVDFQQMLNDYMRHEGIGWILRKGKIVSRGSEAFEATIHRAIQAMPETGSEIAQREIHEAITDLSRRPKPDVTGAIQHAMAALECVARTVTGDANPTLGKLLDRHPGLIPKPLDAAVEKAWGYASERGRHIREGSEPQQEEAELIVGIAASVATYLARRCTIK